MRSLWGRSAPASMVIAGSKSRSTVFGLNIRMDSERLVFPQRGRQQIDIVGGTVRASRSESCGIGESEHESAQAAAAARLRRIGRPPKRAILFRTKDPFKKLTTLFTATNAVDEAEEADFIRDPEHGHRQPRQ